MTRDHFSELRTNGFTRFDGLLDSATIARLTGLAAQTLDALDDGHRERYRSNGSLCNLAELPDFAPLLADERVLGAIRAVGGNDIRWTAGYLISKPAGGDPLFWHQDWWGWDEDISYDEKPVQLFVMIYLTDTSVENGCLRVIPGSHINDHSLHAVPTAHTKDIATAIDLDSPVYSSHPDEVALGVQAGDVLVGDSRLLHSAYANSSGQERSLLTLWYIPDWSSVPGSLQSSLCDIYSRRLDDIDDGSGALKTPEGWPDAARARLEGLVPPVHHTAVPANWNRRPDRTRLKTARVSK